MEVGPALHNLRFSVQDFPNGSKMHITWECGKEPGSWDCPQIYSELKNAFEAILDKRLRLSQSHKVGSGRVGNVYDCLWHCFRSARDVTRGAGAGMPVHDQVRQ